MALEFPRLDVVVLLVELVMLDVVRVVEEFVEIEFEGVSKVEFVLLRTISDELVVALGGEIVVFSIADA